MKTVIEGSIQIYGIGHPNTKTVFSITSEEERNHFRFKDLKVIAGRKLTVWFSYEFEGITYNEESLKLTIPNGTENEIKEFILTETQNYLNQ